MKVCPFCGEKVWFYESKVYSVYDTVYHKYCYSMKVQGFKGHLEENEKHY